MAAARVDEAFEAAPRGDLEEVVAAAKVQRQAIAATDKAIVDKRIVEPADELDAMAVQPLDGADVAHPGAVQRRAINVACAADRHAVVSAGDQGVRAVDQPAATQYDTLAGVRDAVAIEASGTFAANRAAVGDLADAGDTHAIPVTVGLRAVGATDDQATLVEDVAVAGRVEPGIVAAYDRAEGVESSLRIGVDAMPTAGDLPMVGDIGTGSSAQVDAVEAIAGDLAEVVDPGVRAGSHGVGGIGMNHTAACVGDMGGVVGAAHHGIEIDALAQSGGDSAAVDDIQGAVGGGVVDADGIAVTLDQSTSVVVDMVVPPGVRQVEGVDSPGAGGKDGACVIHPDRRNVDGVVECQGRSCGRDAAGRLDGQPVGATQLLWNGCGMADEKVRTLGLQRGRTGNDQGDRQGQAVFARTKHVG